MGYLEETAAQLVANGTFTQKPGSFSFFEASSVLTFTVTLLAFLLPVIWVYPPVPATKSDALNVTHRRLGVAARQSGLKTQHDAQRGCADESGGPPRVHSLWVYPVKSCAGIELARARVLPSGLQYDRMFMLAQLCSTFPVPVNRADALEESHWEMITLRQFRRMALVETDIWVPDETKLRGKLPPDERPTESYLMLRFPWQELGWKGLGQRVAAKLKRGLRAEPEMEVLLPLDYPTKDEMKERGYKMDKVKIWKDTVQAVDMGVELPLELQRYLGVSNKLTLFRCDTSKPRPIYRNAPAASEVGYQPGARFQDAYPVNLMSLGSFQEFSTQVPKDEEITQLDIRRFRSNIIIERSAPYDEETWRLIHIAPEASADITKATFDVCCRCVRCPVPTVDPDTALRHKNQPLETLKRHRDVDIGAPGMGCMAMQLVPVFHNVSNVEDMDSWLEVGMTIDVAKRGEHKYIKMFP